MRKRNDIFTLIGCVLLCGWGIAVSSCDVLERKHQAGVAVQVNGHTLNQSTLDSLTMGLNSEDSAQTAERYISQWVKDALIYDNARSQRNDAIERMVEDYRSRLYVQAYEQRLIAQRMPKEIADSTLEALYTQVADRLILKESIVRGMLVIVPNGAPGMEDLKDWLMIANGEEVKPRPQKQEHPKHKSHGRRIKKEPEVELTEEEKISAALDNIEKYAYQNASGYELFTEEWKTASELHQWVPFERNELDALLKKNKQIEITDSVNTYLLQVADKHLQGEQMPMDYARPQLEEYILSTRQAEFLNSERERIYREAVEAGKVKFFETAASR